MLTVKFKPSMNLPFSSCGIFPMPPVNCRTLLRDIGLAAKRVNVEVNKAGLVDILGDAGTINVQGEEVKKLDVYANDQFTGVLQHGISCAGIASEELDDFVAFDDAKSVNSKYVCLFDPLDGSSNIDVNVSIGTIFCVYRRVTPIGTVVTKEDFLQPGNKQVAAGYIVYGSSTMLVYATRRGVNGFTLDPSIGEWTLSHPDIKCPENGKIYSVNHGNFFQYDEKVKKYINVCQKKDKSKWRPLYTTLYRQYGIGCAPQPDQRVASLCIPAQQINQKENCGCYMSVILLHLSLTVAGGKATNGKERILDVQPTELHQRTPMFIGSKLMMEELETFLH